MSHRVLIPNHVAIVVVKEDIPTSKGNTNKHRAILNLEGHLKDLLHLCH